DRARRRAGRIRPALRRARSEQGPVAPRGRLSCLLVRVRDLVRAGEPASRTRAGRADAGDVGCGVLWGRPVTALVEAVLALVARVSPSQVEAVAERFRGTPGTREPWGVEGLVGTPP